MSEPLQSTVALRWRPGGRSMGKQSRLAVRNIVALALCLPFLYPFYFLIITAFKSSQNYANNRLGLPHPFVFTQFTSAW